MRYRFFTFILFGVLLFLSFAFFAKSSYAVSCSPPISGNYTVSASCSFANTVDGVDAGTGTTNTAVMTIPNAVTLTVGSIANQTIGYGSITIQSGGSIIINKGVGASLVKGPIWMTDADADGYPASTTQYAQGSAPAGGRRRNLLTSVTAADCNDGNAYIFQNVASLVTDADQDGYSPSPTGATQCVGVSAVANTRTYYRDASSAFSWLPVSSLLAGVYVITTYLSSTSWVVLSDVTSVHVVATGGSGYPGGALATKGGSTSADLSVTSGSTMYIGVGYVGGAGSCAGALSPGGAGGAGGYSNDAKGGNGGLGTSLTCGGGGGGGASDVRIGGTALANRVIVAGGSGGGGVGYANSWAGGEGGGATGSAGLDSTYGGWAGGGGVGGAAQAYCANKGCTDGTAGSGGNGGYRGFSTVQAASAGGGGGGYGGGAGASAQASSATSNAGGGGGGGGYSAGTNTVFASGSNANDGFVRLHYTTAVDCNDSNNTIYPGQGC